MKGKTKSGFEFDIDEKIFDDFDFIEAYAGIMNTDAVDGTQITAAVDMIHLLFPKDEEDRLKAFVRDKKTGRVSTTKLFNVVQEIFEAIGTPGKN